VDGTQNNYCYTTVRPSMPGEFDESCEGPK
jgi:hypothetical protein